MWFERLNGIRPEEKEEDLEDAWHFSVDLPKVNKPERHASKLRKVGMYLTDSTNEKNRSASHTRIFNATAALTAFKHFCC